MQPMRNEEADHPFKPGETVIVFAFGPTGIPLIEGRATIIDCSLVPHHYRVRFQDERLIRTRFVHPDWQRDPNRCNALLAAFWRSCGPHAWMEDFYPDEPV